jgi:TonB family protein
MFQEALIESFPHRSRNPGTVLASATIHALALAALGWMSWKTVRKIESPPEPIVFKIGWNPPPPGDGDQRGGAPEIRARLPRAVHAAIHAEQFQPARKTVIANPRDDTDRSKESGDEKTSDGLTESGSGGNTNGDTKGTGNQPVVVTGNATNVIDAARADHSPVLLTRVEPVYPELARKLGFSGVVVLRAVIGTSGLVEDVRVVKSAGALLDAAATSAVGKWIYRPGILDGRPVRVSLTVSVEFSLH